MPEYLIKDAASLLGVSDDTLRRWADAGRIEMTARDSGWLTVDGVALAKLAQRDRQDRLRDLKAALEEFDENANPDAYRALITEYRRLLTQRPDTKTKNAS